MTKNDDKIYIEYVRSEKDALEWAKDLATEYVSAEESVAQISIVGENGITYEIELEAEVHRIPMDVGEDIYQIDNDVDVTLIRKYYVVES